MPFATIPVSDRFWRVAEGLGTGGAPTFAHVGLKRAGGRSGGGGKLGERHPQADIHSFVNRTPWRFPTG
jgi:hypothetical protein